HLRKMRFFDSHGDQNCPKEAIRSRVRFLELNLAAAGDHDSENGLAALDLILCRNVLIYLDPVTVERVATRLLDALSDGGWLLLGAADPMIGHLPGCETIVTAAGIAYRKVGRHARTPAVDQHFASALDAEPPLP